MNYERRLLTQDFNENGETFVYFPSDSFEVKDTLKAAGFLFNSSLLWHIAEVPEGYEDKCIKINLEDVAVANKDGRGEYLSSARKYVDSAIASLLPADTSEWIFEIGEKFEELLVTVKSIKETESYYGWQQIIKMDDKEGNHLSWRTAVDFPFEVGSKVLLKGTVKDLKEYCGVKYTIVTRCKAKGVD